MKYRSILQFESDPIYHYFIVDLQFMEIGLSPCWVAVKGEYFICFSWAVTSWMVVPCIY